MRRALTFSILVVALCVVQTGTVRAEACVADQKGVPVCGTGTDALRVFADTISPSKAYAFAWRSPDGLTVSGAEPPSDVENVLIRIADGAVLTKLGGQYWATGDMRANRYDLAAAWAPDSRAVVEVANSRWDSDSFAYYLLDGKAVTKVDLLALVKPVVKAKVPGKERSNYAFRIHEELPVTLDAQGHLRFTAMLYVPKSEDPGWDFKMQVDIAAKKGKPTARIVSMQKTKVKY